MTQTIKIRTHQHIYVSNEKGNWMLLYYFQNVLDCVHKLVGTDGEVSALAAGNFPFSILHVSVDLITVTAMVMIRTSSIATL